MAQCAFSGTIGIAVAIYTGRTLVSLEAVPDPNVPAFAVRAITRTPGKTSRTDRTDFFLITVPLQRVTAEDLEEVEFTCWPPEVRQ